MAAFKRKKNNPDQAAKPETDKANVSGYQEESTRPFRLVKYFSLTGFSVILVFVLVLTLSLSHQAKNLILTKSNEYASLLAANLNHQVFRQFLVPTALHYGRIRLREPAQQKRLDNVVKATIHGLKVMRVNLYDLEGTISYSTDPELVGQKPPPTEAYKKALQGQNAYVLLTEPGASSAGFNQAWTLRTDFPFRAETRLMGPAGEVLGVFEIYQDLTDDYAAITRFQFISIGISLGAALILFIILRQILVRGERIIEDRNEERRRLEQKLHQSERLAALGQMIAVVAHEIRNPLGIISSTSEILQTKIKNYEPNNRLPEVIVEESRRMNSIVSEFLDFARPQSANFQPCRLHELLDKIITHLTPELAKNDIEAIKEYQGPETIDADPDLLYRALLNVMVNAVQAMPDGGELIVKTELDPGPPQKVILTVLDAGEGLDPDKAPKLFEPFVTTKNRGTGLGLAIVKNIIEEHSGFASISPRDGGGAHFVAQIPVKQG